MNIRSVATTATLVIGLLATLTIPSVAATNARAPYLSRQYQALVRRDAFPAAVQPSAAQGRTINVWGSTFVVPN